MRTCRVVPSLITINEVCILLKIIFMCNDADKYKSILTFFFELLHKSQVSNQLCPGSNRYALNVQYYMLLEGQG